MNPRHWLILIVACVLAGTARAAPPVAAPETPVGRDLAWVLRMFNEDGFLPDPDRLSEAFKQVVPLAQMPMVVQQVRGAMLGEGELGLVVVEETGEGSLSAIARADGTGRAVRILLGHDADGRIETFLIQPAPQFDLDATESWDEFDALLADRPGRVAMGVYELVDPADGTAGETVATRREAIFERSAGERMPLGSAFKLWVLAAAAEEIQAGRMDWDDPVTVREDLKSLPSGTMQVQPAGTEVPLRDAAQSMIAISDNTATDHLIHLVGRERIEALVDRLHPGNLLNRPFMTTREMFVLKVGGRPDLLERYAEADEAERRAMLELDGPLAELEPQPLLLTMWMSRPLEIETVEWFASPREMSDAMSHLRGLNREPGLEPLHDCLRSNPGMGFDRSRWTSVAYKGGSEPGVLCFVWMLERVDGRWFTLCMHLANPDGVIDEGEALRLAAKAVNLLSTHD